MRKIVTTLGCLFVLWNAPALAQVPQFPQNLPPNTVVGRSGIGAGPAQAIPFASLIGLLNNQPNTWSTLQTFNAGIAGTLNGIGQQALNFTILPPASSSGAQVNFSNIQIGDTGINAGANFVNGLNVTQTFGGSGVQGGRQTIFGTAALTSPTSPSNANRNYVGGAFVGTASSGDNGTNTGGGALGGMFGANLVGRLQTGATNWLELSGGEVDCSIATGASAKLKMCWSIVSLSTDVVHAATLDAALTIGAQAGSAGFSQGLWFTGQNGIFPMVATGTMIGSDAGTVAHGIDFSSSTCSSDCFKSLGFTVGPAGQLTSGANGGTGGSLALNGSTSGSSTLNVSSVGVFQIGSVNGGVNVLAGGGTSGFLVLNGSTSGLAEISTSATGGHLNFSGSGSAPTVTGGCNGAGSSISGTDIAGQVNGQTAAATQCTVTFGTAYSAAPFCVVSGQTTPVTSYTPGTGTLVINFASTASAKFNWICYGA